MSRPGVPTSTSQPSAQRPRAACCSRCRRRPRGCGSRCDAPSRRASDSICTTSSRVGAMMSTRGAVGAAAAAGAGVRSSRVKAAIRKAAVLPVPVCDWPATSLPLSASGSAASWIGVVVDEARLADALQDRAGQIERREVDELGLDFGGRLRALRGAAPAPACGRRCARADDADLVEDDERARHQRLVEDVGRRASGRPR